MAKAKEIQQKKPNSIKKLNMNSFERKEYKCVEYRAVASVGTTREEYLDPSYWAHVASQVNHYDIIEVLEGSGKYYAKLIVLDVGRVWVKVQELDYQELGTQVDTPKDGAYEIKFLGAEAQWSVIRQTDKESIKGGFKREEEAATWLKSHLSALAR